MADIDSRDFAPSFNDFDISASSSSSQGSNVFSSNLSTCDSKIQRAPTIHDIDFSKIQMPKQGERCTLMGISVDEACKCFDVKNRTRRKRFYFYQVSRENAWKAALNQWKQWLGDVKVIKLDHKDEPLPSGISLSKSTGYFFLVKDKGRRKALTCHRFLFKDYETKDDTLIACKKAKEKHHEKVKSRKDHKGQPLPLKLFYTVGKGYFVEETRRGVTNRQEFFITTNQTLDELLLKALEAVKVLQGGTIKYRNEKKTKKVRKDCLGNELPEGLVFEGSLWRGSYVVQFRRIDVYTTFKYNVGTKMKVKFTTPQDAYKKAREFHKEVAHQNPKKFNYVYLRPSPEKQCAKDAKSRYNGLREGANSRNIKFEITFEEFQQFIKKNCGHCNVSPTDTDISLDRLSCNDDYLTLSVMPSCAFDNRARGVNSVLVYYGHLLLIVENCLQVAVLLPESYSEEEKKGVLSAPGSLRRFKNNQDGQIRDLHDNESIRQIFNEKIRESKRNGYKWEISMEEFTVAIQLSCTYCGRSANQVNISIDRIDSDKDHISTNACSCCAHCNSLKSVEHYEDVVNHAVKVLTFQGFTIMGTPSMKPIVALSEVMKGDVKKYLEILSKPRLPKILKRKRPGS